MPHPSRRSTTFHYTTLFRSGIDMTPLNRFLFAIREKSFRLLISDQITRESQYLETRNIKERVNRIAPFFEYDNDPYIMIRDDGSLAWLIDGYVSAERYPYSEAYEGEKNYIRNSVKVAISAYSGEVEFYIVDEDRKSTRLNSSHVAISYAVF